MYKAGQYFGLFFLLVSNQNSVLENELFHYL